MNRAKQWILAAVLTVALPCAAEAALIEYHQDFESLLISSPSALSGDGWVVFGNVYTPAHVYLYGYGTFPAPNGGSAFSDIDSGQGGAGQGAQQLAIYSDYNNGDHANGNLVESNVFHEQTIGAGDVGQIWRFQFDAKRGNLVSPSTALAFIKTLDPNAGYATTNFLTYETTALPTTWGTFTITITITPALVGQLLQFGFSNTATLYQSSGIFYDNVHFFFAGNAGVGDGVAAALALSPASPNPFHESTRLDYSVATAGFADVSVFDVAGRRVATLFRGAVQPGAHTAFWDGRDAGGRLAPAGVYRAVLQTGSGRETRGIVLSR